MRMWKQMSSVLRVKELSASRSGLESQCRQTRLAPRACEIIRFGINSQFADLYLLFAALKPAFAGRFSFAEDSEPSDDVDTRLAGLGVNEKKAERSSARSALKPLEFLDIILNRNSDQPRMGQTIAIDNDG